MTIGRTWDPTRARLRGAFTVVLVGLMLSAGAPATGGEDSGGDPGMRFGYSAKLLFDLSRADASTALSIWAKEFAKQSGSPKGAKATIYDDMDSLIAAVRNGQTDFVAISSLDYLKIRRMLSLEPAMIGMKNGISSEEQILLVRRDAGYSRIGQLQGKRLVLIQSAREFALLWLDTLLVKQGLAPTEAYFGNVKDTPKAQQAILSVFFRQADACVVHRNAFRMASELNPQVWNELEILSASPPFPLGVTCFRPNISTKKKNLLYSSYDKLIKTPSGRQVLTLFRIDGSIRAQNEDFELLENLLEEHERLFAHIARQAR